MQRSVAVVGGGVGGLAAAAGFARDGWTVTVLERATGPATDGTALGMWPAAVRALDTLGLGDGLRERSTRETSMALCRPDGRRLVTVDTSALDRRAGRPRAGAGRGRSVRRAPVDVDRRRGSVAHLVARPDLIGLLAGALPAGVLRYGCPVDGAGLGALRSGHDLVVGADGIRSTARSVLSGRPAADHLRPTGTVAFRGVAAVRVDAGTETWGRGARFGVLPHGAGRDRANWYATLPAADVHSAGDDLALLGARFGDWHDPVPRVLDRIGSDGYLRHDLCDVHPHLPRYTDGRSLAVLGDAAHAMTPDLGQGACQALVDGVALAAALRDRSVPDGLAAYDRARRRPTQRLVTLARLVHRLAQARRGTAVRDALLWAAPL